MLVYLFYCITFDAPKNETMKTIKATTLQRHIIEGRVECLTDFRLGRVEIRSNITGRRFTINVI